MERGRATKGQGGREGEEQCEGRRVKKSREGGSTEVHRDGASAPRLIIIPVRCTNKSEWEEGKVEEEETIPPYTPATTCDQNKC